MKLSRQHAIYKLLAVKEKYSLTDNEKQAIDKAVKALEISRNLPYVQSEISNLEIVEDESGCTMVSLDSVRYILEKNLNISIERK